MLPNTTPSLIARLRGRRRQAGRPPEAADMGTALAMECWLGEQRRAGPTAQQAAAGPRAWWRRWLQPSGLRRTRI
jgi:hypothetical protein